MPDSPDRLAQLEQQIAALTQRIFRLERALNLQPAAPPPVAAAAPVAPPPAAAPAAPVAAAPVVAAPPKPPRDLESQIGSHWLNRIGIVAALIGASLLLKYSWDNHWIGPGGIVAIEMLAGIGFVLWSEWFRKKEYVYFSYGLKGIGVSFMYFSLFAAFHYYHLFPEPRPEIYAMAGMIAITAATAIIALKQEAQVVAFYAVIGGLATPLLLSTGQNREVALFTYVAVLDVATLALVALRPWRRLLIGSFIGTLILYIGWYSEFYDNTQLTPTVAFATIFFLLFAAVPMVSRDTWLRREMKPHATVVFLPFLNALAYFFQLFAMLNDTPQHQSLLAYIAIGVAAFYILLARLIRGEGEEVGQQKLVRLLQVAIGIGFLTVAVPLKLSSHWITVGWLVESAILIWIGWKNSVDLVKYFGVVALSLGVFRLLVLDDFVTTRLLFNARFGLYLLAIAILGGIVYFGIRSGAQRTGIAIAIVAINLLALWGVNLEIVGYFGRLMNEMGQAYARHNGGQWDWAGYDNLRLARDFTLSAWWMVYGAALMAIGFWKRSAFLRWQAIILIVLTIGKVFTYDTWNLGTGWKILSFFALAALLLAVSFVYSRDWLKLSKKAAGEEAQAAGGGQ